MFYLVYEIKNKINGKIYVGAHKTENKNDDYMGSGLLLRKAIQKYGIENFDKTILYEAKNEQEMFSKEKQLITIGKNSYNLKQGGNGGWDYVNKSGQNNKSNQCRLGGLASSGFRGKKHKEESKKKIGEAKIDNKIWVGRKHKEETRKKMSETHREKENHFGEKNSQYGTMWITNGLENKKIKKGQEIPKNWRAGRTVMQRIANP
jgi:group I intron endonuclease